MFQIVTLVGGLVKRSAGAVTYYRALLGLGMRRALLISGLVHDLWELPAMNWTSFDHGAVNRVIVIPLFLLTLRLASVYFGSLRLTTGRVRPAAQSGFNIFWERFDVFTETRSPLVLDIWQGKVAFSPYLRWRFWQDGSTFGKTKQGCSSGRSFLTGYLQ